MTAVRSVWTRVGRMVVIASLARVPRYPHCRRVPLSPHYSRYRQIDSP